MENMEIDQKEVRSETVEQAQDEWLEQAIPAAAPVTSEAQPQVTTQEGVAPSSVPTEAFLQRVRSHPKVSSKLFTDQWKTHTINPECQLFADYPPESYANLRETLIPELQKPSVVQTGIFTNIASGGRYVLKDNIPLSERVLPTIFGIHYLCQNAQAGRKTPIAVILGATKATLVKYFEVAEIFGLRAELRHSGSDIDSLALKQMKLEAPDTRHAQEENEVIDLLIVSSVSFPSVSIIGVQCLIIEDASLLSQATLVSTGRFAKAHCAGIHIGGNPGESKDINTKILDLFSESTNAVEFSRTISPTLYATFVRQVAYQASGGLADRMLLALLQWSGQANPAVKRVLIVGDRARLEHACAVITSSLAEWKNAPVLWFAGTVSHKRSRLLQSVFNSLPQCLMFAESFDQGCPWFGLEPSFTVVLSLPPGEDIVKRRKEYNDILLCNSTAPWWLLTQHNDETPQATDGELQALSRTFREKEERMRGSKGAGHIYGCVHVILGKERWAEPTKGGESLLQPYIESQSHGPFNEGTFLQIPQAQRADSSVVTEDVAVIASRGYPLIEVENAAVRQYVPVLLAQVALGPQPLPTVGSGSHIKPVVDPKQFLSLLIDMKTTRSCLTIDRRKQARDGDSRKAETKRARPPAAVGKETKSIIRNRAYVGPVEQLEFKRSRSDIPQDIPRFPIPKRTPPPNYGIMRGRPPPVRSGRGTVMRTVPAKYYRGGRGSEGFRQSARRSAFERDSWEERDQSAARRRSIGLERDREREEISRRQIENERLRDLERSRTQEVSQRYRRYDEPLYSAEVVYRKDPIRDPYNTYEREPRRGYDDGYARENDYDKRRDDRDCYYRGTRRLERDRDEYAREDLQQIRSAELRRDEPMRRPREEPRRYSHSLPPYEDLVREGSDYNQGRGGLPPYKSPTRKNYDAPGRGARATTGGPGAPVSVSSGVRLMPPAPQNAPRLSPPRPVEQPKNSALRFPVRKPQQPEPSSYPNTVRPAANLESRERETREQPKGRYEKMYDENTGKYFYVDHLTKHTSWVAPAGFEQSRY